MFFMISTKQQGNFDYFNKNLSFSEKIPTFWSCFVKKDMSAQKHHKDI